MKILIIVCIWAVVEMAVHFNSFKRSAPDATPKVFVELPESESNTSRNQLGYQLTVEQPQSTEEHVVYMESTLDEEEEAFWAQLFEQKDALVELESATMEHENNIVFIDKESKQQQNEAIWQVEVIGSEEEYIHVLHNGARKWLFVGEHQFTKYSLLKIHLDCSQGVEDVLDIEVLYNAPGYEESYIAKTENNYAMVL